ncbi:MAG TPA: hypothetical protein VJL39_03805 [Candidatus Paceibacterota bacterium]
MQQTSATGTDTKKRLRPPVAESYAFWDIHVPQVTLELVIIDMCGEPVR